MLFRISSREDNWNRKATYHDLMQYIRELIFLFPDFIALEYIGTSADKRKIPLLTVARRNSPEKQIKNHFCFVSGVHGRETVNPLGLLHLAYWYARYRKDWLTWNCLYLIPVLNPDGYVIATEGKSAISNIIYQKKIKEKKTDAALWKWNARGIDINRNFPSVLWEKTETSGYPASEKETLALMGFLNHHSVQVFVDIHSRGNQIYYYRKTESDSYNVKQRLLAEEMRELTGYTLMEPDQEVTGGDCGGNTVHYAAEHYKIPAFTLETIPEEASFPLPFSYQEDIFEKIVLIPMKLV